METEELITSAGETIEYAKIYVEQQKQFFHLEASKRLAKTTSKLMMVAILAFLGFMIFMLLTLALAFFLGSYLGSYGFAFLILTGFFALLAFAIYFFKDKIIAAPIQALIIEEMLH